MHTPACVLLGRTASKLRAESSLARFNTEGGESSLTSTKKRESKRKAKMIIVGLVHIPGSLTAEHELPYYKEISFKIKLQKNFATSCLTNLPTQKFSLKSCCSCTDFEKNLIVGCGEGSRYYSYFKVHGQNTAMYLKVP